MRLEPNTVSDIRYNGKEYTDKNYPSFKAVSKNPSNIVSKDVVKSDDAQLLCNYINNNLDNYDLNKVGRSFKWVKDGSSYYLYKKLDKTAVFIVLVMCLTLIGGLIFFIKESSFPMTVMMIMMLIGSPYFLLDMIDEVKSRPILSFNNCKIKDDNYLHILNHDIKNNKRRFARHVQNLYNSSNSCIVLNEDSYSGYRNIIYKKNGFKQSASHNTITNNNTNNTTNVTTVVTSKVIDKKKDIKISSGVKDSKQAGTVDSITDDTIDLNNDDSVNVKEFSFKIIDSKVVKVKNSDDVVITHNEKTVDAVENNKTVNANNVAKKVNSKKSVKNSKSVYPSKDSNIIKNDKNVSKSPKVIVQNEIVFKPRDDEDDAPIIKHFVEEVTVINKVGNFAPGIQAKLENMMKNHNKELKNVHIIKRIIDVQSLYSLMSGMDKNSYTTIVAELLNFNQLFIKSVVIDETALYEKLDNMLLNINTELDVIIGNIIEDKSIAADAIAGFIDKKFKKNNNSLEKSLFDE